MHQLGSGRQDIQLSWTHSRNRWISEARIPHSLDSQCTMRDQHINRLQGFGFECIFTHTPLHKSQLDLQNSTELKQAWNKGESYWTETKSVRQTVTNNLGFHISSGIWTQIHHKPSEFTTCKQILYINKYQEQSQESTWVRKRTFVVLCLKKNEKVESVFSSTDTGISIWNQPKWMNTIHYYFIIMWDIPTSSHHVMWCWVVCFWLPSILAYSLIRW